MNASPQEGLAVPGRGSGQRAGAGARAPVADRHDAAGRLPHGARAAPASDTPARRARRRAPARARAGRQSADRRGRRRRERRRPGAGAGQDAVRPAARLGRRGEGPQERQGRVRIRGPGDRDLHRDRAPCDLAVGDDETARLAASIRAEEEKMLQRVLREIPKLTDAVVRAEVKGNPSYDVTKTGAADAVRDAGRAADETARATGTRAKRTARQARKVPASRALRARSRAPSRPKAIWRSPATTSSPRTRSSAAWPSSRRSTWRRSTPTSAGTKTAAPS